MALDDLKIIIGRALMDHEFRDLLLTHRTKALMPYNLTADELDSLRYVTPAALDSALQVLISGMQSDVKK